MTCDPLDRCLGCGGWILDPTASFCDGEGGECERRYAERRVLRRLTMINALAHAKRVRARLRAWLRLRA